MTIQQLHEDSTSTELLDKAKKALTPEQYQRMQDKAIEKIGIIRLSSMNLDGLKNELPTLVHGDPEEQDILSRLEVEFPGIKTSKEEKKIPEEKSKTSEPIKFTEHPMDWAKGKVKNGKEWAYEALVPDRLKKANEMSKNGDSSKAIAATVIAGVTAGEVVRSAEKAISWFDKLKSDPIAFFKELFSVLFSFDFNKIKAFFSSTMDSIGITTDMAKGFAEKIGIPSALVKSGISLFSSEGFGKINYGDLGKIYQEYQKDPTMNIAKKLGISEKGIPDAIKVMENIFGKKANDVVGIFVDKGGSESTLADTPMADIIKKIAG